MLTAVMPSRSGFDTRTNNSLGNSSSKSQPSQKTKTSKALPAGQASSKKTKTNEKDIVTEPLKTTKSTKNISLKDPKTNTKSSRNDSSTSQISKGNLKQSNTNSSKSKIISSSNKSDPSVTKSSSRNKPSKSDIVSKDSKQPPTKNKLDKSNNPKDVKTSVKNSSVSQYDKENVKKLTKVSSQNIKNKDNDINKKNKEKSRVASVSDNKKHSKKSEDKKNDKGSESRKKDGKIKSAAVTEQKSKPTSSDNQQKDDVPEHISEHAAANQLDLPLDDSQEENFRSLSQPAMENIINDPHHSSLDTLESGISMTSAQEFSDGEVEESISSRFVEVDEMEINEDPSPPSSSFLTVAISERSSSQPENLYENDDDNLYYEDFEDYESDFEDGAEESDEEVDGHDDDGNDDDDDDDDSKESDNEAPNPEMDEILKAMAAENNRPKVSLNTKVYDPLHNVEDPTHKNKVVLSNGVIENPVVVQSRPKSSRAYVNFAKAKQQAKVGKASEKIRNRGQLLQEMIQLDSITIDLFTQVPESYESYIAAFGHANYKQVFVQTNEDALSEYVQTDALLMLSKWTQKPIHITVNGEELPTSEDYLGVGGDMTVNNYDSDNYSAYLAVASDSGRLSKFLIASSQVVLLVLEEESILANETNLDSTNDESLGFSKSGINLGSGLHILLKGRPVTHVCFCPSDSSLLLTGHGFKEINHKVSSKDQPKENDDAKDTLEDQPNKNNDLEDTLDNQTNNENDDLRDTLPLSYGALFCLWSVSQPSLPQKILCCRSPPVVSCFSPGKPVVIIGGLLDGSLAAWDLRENASVHPFNISVENIKWRLSPPSYLTACSPDDVYEGSQIVALETIRTSGDDSGSHNGSFQVVSLSSSGQLTWWVLVQEGPSLSRSTNINSGISPHLGAAPWSKISLVRAATFSVANLLTSDDLMCGESLCYDLKLLSSDNNQLLIATANGSVLHCSRHNIKAHPSAFVTEIEPGSEAVSIAICPHDSQYFLVGGSDGLIRLHSTSFLRPLTCWQASINPAPIKRIKWSPSRPCVFYMLDLLGMFHVWDLSAGDIYPIISIDDGSLIAEQVIAFDLASTIGDNQPVYAVFASKSGVVSIRSISAQYLRTNEEAYKNELERFKCYVNII